MIASELYEFVVGCLLKDVIGLDLCRKARSIDQLLDECYGITSPIISHIVGNYTPETISSCSPAHIVRYIESNYLRLPKSLVWTPLRTTFLEEYTDPLSGWFDPTIKCYGEKINYPDHPKKTIPIEVVDYLCDTIRTLCREEYGKTCFLSRLIDCLENLGAYLSPDDGTHSLFEIAKLRAGLVTCIYLCLEEQGMKDYQQFFADPIRAGRPCVLVCSLDFLGIKDFKFQSAFSTQLQDVVAASFYIDLFRENVLDDFLSEVGITRCNLVFSGGRHLHLFLPNTSDMVSLVEAQMRKINDWIVSQYQLDIYISYGMHPAYMLDCYDRLNDGYYIDIFTNIANQKALIEAKKYSADNLIQINQTLTYQEEADLLKQRTHIVRYIADNFFGKFYIAISTNSDNGIPIGPNRYAYACSAIPTENSILRVYTLKHDDILPLSECSMELIRIWHHDISTENIDLQNSSLPTIGIFRMDIDNFRTYMLKQNTGEIKTPPPTKMELSKQFAMFLRRDVPRLIRQYKRKQEDKGGSASVSVIHEGADDIFILGQIHDLLSVVRLMYFHYRRFTVQKMSFSAGISIYNSDESLMENIQLAQQLLDQAKTIPGKDGVVFRDSSGKYKWRDFFNHEFDF